MGEMNGKGGIVTPVIPVVYHNERSPSLDEYCIFLKDRVEVVPGCSE
jgi:hypothetical protein